jgi:hypothetical protein
MSLKEHTRVTLESRGKLNQIGEIVVESLNEMARAHEAGEPLPNHTPSSPAFWFAGLAREHGGRSYGGQFENDAPIASNLIRSRLSDAALLLARRVLSCRCDERWGSWVMSPAAPIGRTARRSPATRAASTLTACAATAARPTMKCSRPWTLTLRPVDSRPYERPRFDALAHEED